MARVAENVVREFAERVSALGHGERGDFIQTWADSVGVSRDTAYRYLKRYGVTQAKKRRSDAGRRALNEEQLRQVAALKEASRRRTGQVLMPSTVAREIAVENGIIENISTGYLNALLREQNLDTRTLSKAPKQGLVPQTHLERRSDWPTQWYYADASACVQYDFGKKGKLKFESPHKFYGKDVESYRRKKKIILRLAIVDHFTSNFYIHYYHVPGESADVWVDFLIKAFLSKEDPSRFPMIGVPHNLYTDKGSGLVAAKTQNLLRYLGINSQTHLPGNPRAKAAAETYQRVWQSEFESRLSIRPVGSIEELNFLKEQVLIKVHHEKQMSKRNYNTRAQLWEMGQRLIPEGEHRVLPEDNLEAVYALAHIQPVTRTVTSANTISFKLPSDERSREYRLDVNGIQGEKVQVYPHAYRANTLMVLWREEKYEARAIERDEFGFASDAVPLGEHRRAKDSVADIRAKQVAKVDLAEVDPFAGTEKKPNVASLSARTPKTTIEVTKENPYVSEDAAREYLRRSLGPVKYRNLIGEIDSALSAGKLRRAEMEELAEELAARLTRKHA